MTDLDQRYIATKALTEYFVDKVTGKPITGGWVEFYKDNDRSSPKLVYQLSGSPPNYTFETLPNPIDISVGSLMNGDAPPVAVTPYYFPYDEKGDVELYYIKIYNEDAILQKELEAWPPNVSGNSSPTDAGNIINNQVSNPQFVDILFNEDYGTTISISGPVSNLEAQIAPDWFLRISTNGAGSVVVNRNELAGSLNIETNPPYELSILPQGGSVSELKLVQRFQHNPDIWASGYLAGGFLASSSDGVSHEIIMAYSPSVEVSPTVITSGETGTSGYIYSSNTILLGLGINTDLPSVGYVDLEFTLPVNGGVNITSIFLAGLDANDTISYDQETVNRQEDYLFHYYNPLIRQVPVPSIAQGWDFKVNPAQFSQTIAMGAVASQYLWDQTIGWQSVNGAVTASRASPRSLNIQRNTTSQFALIQYLTGTQLQQLLSNSFSMVIKALTNLAAGASGTVSFWVTSDATLPSVNTGSNLSLINTIDANGKPATFHGNWTEIPRNYRGDGRFTIPFGTEMSEIAIEGWNQTLRTLAATYTYAAIVVGFASDAASSVTFDSISVTPGLLARPYSPLSYNETLTQMQYYYEKSYAEDVYASSVTTVNTLVRYQVGVKTVTDYAIRATGFSIEFRNMKRKTAVTNVYSPNGVGANVRLLELTTLIGDVSISSWTQTAGSYSAVFIPNTGVPLHSSVTALEQATIQFHYSADARLGIVL